MGDQKSFKLPLDLTVHVHNVHVHVRVHVNAYHSDVSMLIPFNGVQ